MMKLRLEYWEKVKDIEPKNLVFLDETGVLLGLRRTHARSERGVHLTFANTSSGKLTIKISTAKRKDKGNTLDIPRSPR